VQKLSGKENQIDLDSGNNHRTYDHVTESDFTFPTIIALKLQAQDAAGSVEPWAMRSRISGAM